MNLERNLEHHYIGHKFKDFVNGFKSITFGKVLKLSHRLLFRGLTSHQFDAHLDAHKKEHLEMYICSYLFYRPRLQT